MGYRITYALCWLLVATVLMTAVLSRWSLPGATPDSVLVVVVALALAGGPRMGVGAGFAGGLLLDVTPPAIVPVGTNAFALCLMGALVGRYARRSDRTVGMTLGIVASAAVGAQLLRALMGLISRDGRVDVVLTLGLGASAALYAVLLAPFLIPVVTSLYDKLPRTGLPSSRTFLPR